MKGGCIPRDRESSPSLALLPHTRSIQSVCSSIKTTRDFRCILTLEAKALQGVNSTLVQHSVELYFDILYFREVLLYLSNTMSTMPNRIRPSQKENVQRPKQGLTSRSQVPRRAALGNISNQVRVQPSRAVKVCKKNEIKTKNEIYI